jgi:imidazolonepropionase-like amidohydrolase
MTIVLKGGTLIDGTGRDPVPDTTVVIEGGRIAAVGSETEVDWSPGAPVIDVAGRTILPGFVDVHCHMIAYEYDLQKRLTTPASLTVLKSIENLRTTLAAGVTTVRDAGGADLGLKLGVEQGLVPGPRLFIAIVPLTQRGGLFDLNLASGAELDMTGMLGRIRHFTGGVESMRQAARELILAGADVIKVSVTGSVYETPGQIPAPQFTPQEIDAAIYEAQAAGKTTMTHCEGGPGLRNAVEAGVDSIDHGFYLTDEDCQLMIDHGTFLVPTLACNYGILKVIERDPEAGIREQSVRVARELIADHAASFRKAAEMGVKIAMGSDAFGWDQGENLFELELMVDAGLTPMEAIVAGTRSGAELLGVEDELGTLAPGKVADVLVVDGDPLDDISILQDRDNLLMIMKAGEVFKDEV